MRAIRHPEWRARTDGSLRYTRDAVRPDALVGRILRSPHAAARIIAVDTTRAAREPGVVAVVTAANLPRRLYRDHGVSDRPALAGDVVRHRGQEVAAVAAESVEAAERALRLIDVRYEPARAVTTLDAALARRAPQVHEGRHGNEAAGLDRSWGDLQAASAETARRLRASYRYGMQAHACMEPHAVQALWRPTERRLELWTPTQAARNIRREVAHMLDLAEEQVRLHRVGVGGDFGSRVRASDVEVIAAALSMACGRPVVVDLSREDEFANTKHRHDFVIDLESGVDAAGAVTYRDAHVLVEAGSYCHAGGNELNYASILLGSHYRVLGARVRGSAVYTNRRPGGSFRGAGGPQAVFAMESQLDELAERLGVDPIEARLAAAPRPGEKTVTGWEIDSSGMRSCLELVRERIGWDEKRRLGGTGRGVGVAVATHVSGAHVSEEGSRAEAVVVIEPDGCVTIVSGSSDPGTGETAVLAQICARELGLDPASVAVETMDTDRTPYDPGAGASRGTTVTGAAAVAASRAAADHLREVAAGKFGVAPEGVALEGGQARSAGGSGAGLETPGWDADRLGLGELAAISPLAEDGILRLHREAAVPLPVDVDQHGYGNLSSSYAFAAHAVEVEVDRVTGKVKVLQVVAAHDSGTIINPSGARGQVTGGVVMALGAALGEEMVWEGGRLANPSFVDYHLPRAADAPPIDVVFVEEPSRHGPYGAKGLAEIALMPTAAALANAVAHATGVRVRELPLTPDRILPRWPAAARAARPRSLWTRPGRWWIAALRWAYPRGLHRVMHRWGTLLARTPAQGAVRRIERPRTAAEAVDLLAECPDARPTGGGTDALVTRRQGLHGDAVLVFLGACASLTRIDETDAGDLRIGGAATLSQLERRVRDSDPGIASTVRSVASPQLRATATVGGNLCQEKRCWYYRHGFACYKRGGPACPCYAVAGDHRFFHAAMGAHRCQAVTPSDLAVVFAALDAVFGVEGVRGRRTVPAGEFFSGPGETVLDRGEILSDVTVPAAARARRTRFEKLNLSQGGFAVVSTAVSIAFASDGAGRVEDCRVVIGGVAPVPLRVRTVEEYLTGLARGVDPSEHACGAWARDAHPLPGNAWKLDAAAGLVARSARELLRT